MPVPPGPPSRNSRTGALAEVPRSMSAWSCPPDRDVDQLRDAARHVVAARVHDGGCGRRPHQPGHENEHRKSRDGQEATSQQPMAGLLAGRRGGASSQHDSVADADRQRQEHEYGVDTSTAHQCDDAVQTVQPNAVHGRAIGAHPGQLEDQHEHHRRQQQGPPGSHQPTGCEPQPRGGHQGNDCIRRRHRPSRGQPPGDHLADATKAPAAATPGRRRAMRRRRRGRSDRMCIAPPGVRREPRLPPSSACLSGNPRGEGPTNYGPWAEVNPISLCVPGTPVCDSFKRRPGPRPNKHGPSELSPVRVPRRLLSKRSGRPERRCGRPSRAPDREPHRGVAASVYRTGRCTCLP